MTLVRTSATSGRSVSLIGPRNQVAKLVRHLALLP
jgi:hypothetical protein